MTIRLNTDNTPYEKIGNAEPVSIADEVPFDIPDSWSWIRLGNAVINYDSKRKPVTKNDRKSVHGYYDYYGATGAIDRVDDYLFEGEFLMIGEDGGNFFTERDNSFIAKGKFWANNHVHVVQPILLNIWFVKFFLDSCNLASMGLINGIAVPKLNQSNMNSILIPIPPINEQAKIVESINMLSPFIDEYSICYESLEALNNSFPEQLKKSILQMAVQGKLVPQDENDEPASVLLERIHTEKQRLIAEGRIKKDKNESVIFRRDNSHYEKRGTTENCIDEEIPFEIPDNWCWCRLGTIVSVLGGKRIPAGQKLTKENTGHIYIRVSDMKDGWVSTSDLHYVPQDIFPSISKYIINKEDIFITVAGTIGRVGKIPYELDGANLTENADRLVFSIINQDWLIKVLQSPLIQYQISEATTKVGQPKLALARIERMLIALPPIEEQKRIVSTVNNLMNACNLL